MIKLFSKSKINLNYTDSSVAFNFKQLTKIFLNRRVDDTLKLRTPNEVLAHIKTLLSSRRAQIKGRNFEIPAAGGFLLTQYANGIEEYFTPGKEIATFKTVPDLCDKIKYYLLHDSERETMRRAGHVRAIKEHTLQRRFGNVFKIIYDQQKRS
jgi:spore maturation protein CgeB